METRESITQEASNQEEWREIPGYEGLYEASSLGRIRGVDRVTRHGHRRKGQIRKPVAGKGGYRRVILHRDGKAEGHLVHRLVWGAFSGPIPEGMHVDHIDNDPANNRLGNLQVLTPYENTARKKLFGTSTADLVASGKHHLTRRTHCPNNHPHFEGNNVPGKAKVGRRSCLICDRARTYIRDNNIPPHQHWIIRDMYAERLLLDLESAEKV